MQEYCERITVQDGPRLPLEGSIDLTYRSNNACRHCWVSIPANSSEREKELSFDEIIRIVDEARAMGCRKWAIGDRLDGKKKLRDVLRELLAEFEAPEGEIEQELVGLVDELVRRRILAAVA
jgi:MoaA/NifB/PqqE/SkfB family radical SAM enzyme